MYNDRRRHHETFLLLWDDNPEIYMNCMNSPMSISAGGWT